MIGHILFTRAIVIGTTVYIQLLGPLAILPDFQNTGVGDKLIKEGLTQLKRLDVALVFVLGHPDYYPRTGFKPAGVLGFQAPYPIPEKHAGAWMVQELSPGTIKDVSGKIQCCAVFNQPEHWREQKNKLQVSKNASAPVEAFLLVDFEKINLDTILKILSSK